MAKSSAPSKTETPSVKPNALAHTVKLAHPDELPTILTIMESDGWQLLHIVGCKSGQHAAYFRRNV